MKTKLVNKNTFNLKSTITDDWGSSHRIELDIEALTSAKDWKLGLDLPEGYEVKDVYGALVTQENGKSYTSGANIPDQMWNQYLDKGDKTKVVFIVLEGNQSNLDPIKPDFFFADTSMQTVGNVPQQSKPTFGIDSQITENWDGGYKLELGLTPESNAKNWKLDFNLPYNIAAAYGVDMINHGNGKYTISGQNDQVSLNKGQSIQPVFIIEDNGQDALVPEFIQPKAIAPIVETPKVSVNESKQEVTPEAIAPTPVVEKPKTAAPTPQQEATPAEIAPDPVEKKAAAKLGVNPSIIEDWDGGYKLAMNVTAETKSNNWQVDLVSAL